MFNFWPFGYVSAIFFRLFDGALNTVGTMHMLYLTLAVLRSVQAGSSYQREPLMRYPVLVMILIWTLSILIFVPITLTFGIDPYTTNIKISPSFTLAINLITWFLPLLTVIVLGFYILIVLKKHHKRKMRIQNLDQIRLREVLGRRMSENNNNLSTVNMVGSRHNLFYRRILRALERVRELLNLETHIRFQLVIISYWAQWLPFTVVNLINPLCACVPNLLWSIFNWLTYSVSLTNPVLAIFTNSRVVLFKKQNDG